jgi:hypothetical protein
VVAASAPPLPPRVDAQPASVVKPNAIETIEVVVKRRNM